MRDEELTYQSMLWRSSVQMVA